MQLPTLRIGEPEQNFKVFCVALLIFALLTSVAESDVSSSLAVLGLVGATASNLFLLQTAVWLIPGSIVVDIIRLSVHNHYGGFIFLDVIEMAIKVACTYFAYALWRSISRMQDMGSPNAPLAGDYEGSSISSSRAGVGATGLQFQQYAPPAGSLSVEVQSQQEPSQSQREPPQSII